MVVEIYDVIVELFCDRVYIFFVEMMDCSGFVRVMFVFC